MSCVVTGHVGSRQRKQGVRAVAYSAVTIFGVYFWHDMMTNAAIALQPWLEQKGEQKALRKKEINQDRQAWKQLAY